MLAASGCHKDSFDFDEFTRPTTTTNSDDGTPRTPNIRISSTDRTAQEGSGQVVLVINSDDDAPAGGLAVMITIAGAMAGDFTANAPCTANLVCTVRILEDNRVVNLVLTPTSDSAEENSERWTASLVDSSNYNFAANNNVAFDITDPTTPGPMIPSLPVVGIATGDMPIEDGAGVTLTITSSETVPATLTGGLSVTINIVGANADEFTANAEADCTTDFPRCIVTIPAGSNSVSLILSPLSDFSTETESWRASLRDGSNYDLAANFNVDFAITDLIAAIGIMTSDMPVEDGAGVTLTITSSETVPATLTGGLSVTINIGVADAADFNNAVCTNLVCIVTIPAGSNSVSLILSPLSDFSTEPGERWTATLEDGSNYNLDAGNNNVGFAITDLIAAVGIATSNTGIEGGAAVTLTITSSETVPATLTGGLAVTVNIGGMGVVAADFTSADCTNTQCVVRIPPGMSSVELIITPLDDDAPEGGSEDWTATIAPDTINNIFTVDSNADDATFAVANMLPPVTEALMIADLNAYNSPIPLAVSEIRAGVESASVGPIVGFQYNDADNNPRVLVERLDYAHLGIRINGDIAAADFDFAHLNENVVTPPTTSSTLPTATYALEGEMTYNGNRFYPDGALMADFANAEVSGEISLDGQEAADDFGGTTFADGTTAITNSDNLTLGLNAAGISGDAFSGTGNLAIVAAEGFFASLLGRPAGDYSGRFNDDTTSYDAATDAPTEISGIFGGITDANGNALNGGFLGQCSADCRLPIIIGISSSADTIQEGGQVVLMITSDAVASAGGFLVTIDISGAMDGEFTTTPASVCDSNLVCRVTILENERSVNLILSPTDDSDNTENTENWMATLRDGSNYNRDAANNNVAFDITDPTPPPANGTTLAELNNFDSTPTDLAANVIRNRRSESINGAAITGSRYDDPSDMPQIYVQMLEFAALGIWVDGNAPEIGVDDYDYDYAFLGDNVVNSPAMTDGRGSATYNVEGDATYRGLNFFPDGSMAADFDMRTFRLVLEAGDGGGAFDDDAFGGIDPSDEGDNFALVVNGDITDEGFGASFTISGQSGFFSDLSGVSASLTGRFYNDVLGYNPAAAAPTEIAGVIETSIGSGADELNLGFLGRRP